MELSVCLCWLILLLGVQAEQSDDRRAPLHLLNILPYPDSGPDAGWDKAYELIPAAELAVDEINDNPQYLPGYKLNLVNVDSEACGSSLITDGLVNTYSKVFNPTLNVVGLAGLFCSTVTDTIASTFSKNSSTYLQVAGSTSPVHRNASKFPWLVHLISSSTMFNEALLSLAVQFEWKRIGIIYNALSVLHRENAADMKMRAMEANISTSEFYKPIVGGMEEERIFTILTDSRIRIVYISALASQSVQIMCEAYKRNALYPGYVFIFPERSLADLLSVANKTTCNTDQITKALEGAIFMKYKLINRNATELVSNRTYEEYNEEYLQRLMEMELVNNSSLSKSNVYANVMHDQIWAFALALNKSLQTFQEQNISITSLQLHQTERFANIVRSKFANVSFQGASGFIKFNSGKEESSVVNISQVSNGTEEVLGEFNPDSFPGMMLQLNINILPKDSFKNITLLLPLWESTMFNAVFLVFIAVTTFVLIFLLVFKDRPEVKASSPSLSFAMIAGCYLTFVSALARNIHGGFAITNSHIFTVLCNVEVWLWMIGLTLLFSALLLRLLRINHIFHAYGKVSPYWKDRYMVLWILVICCGAILILTVWTVVDQIKMVPSISYQPNASPPFFEKRAICSCEMFGLWLFLTLSYNGIFVIVIVFLSVQTRKIRLSNFKNTKQINAFILLTCMTLGLLVPLHYVIGMDRNSALGHFIVTFAFSCTGVYCQLFVFLPQVFATMKNIILRKSRRSALKRESQFSRTHFTKPTQ